MPEGVWLTRFLNDPRTKENLGVPSHVNFSNVNQEVHKDFINAGDMYVWLSKQRGVCILNLRYTRVQPAHLMFPPLLQAGIRLVRMYYSYSVLPTRPEVRLWAARSPGRLWADRSQICSPRLRRLMNGPQSEPNVLPVVKQTVCP